ncbi:MAG: arylsulfatase family protein [Alphaproteobacteria bacterium]|nr:arylsulfatase family protein [Alphaproteobacteria bacterium]
MTEFPGTIGRTVAGSEPYWPPRPCAAGKPNVVIVLADDLGFADLGCYGSEIATPHLDALAARGLRFTNFHVTPMCSPTRAALLTGLNPHAAGIGHVAHSDPGFPGYAMELATDAATSAELLRDAGYATLMVGKWHLAKDSDCSDAGPRHSWPCQRGFDRFYGFLDGFTNLHHPHRLVSDNTAVNVDEYPDGYYLTDDLTDRAIEMVQSVKASDPSKPFFLYFAHGAVHAPLHAKEVDVLKYRDRYRAGWDALRSERFARQLSLGILPPETVLPPRNSERGNDVVPWDSLPVEQQELFARYMEVYAGMVDSIDQQFGRLMAALDALGELDNTIVLFTSDNGASREGEASGTTAYYQHLLGTTDLDADLSRLDEIGGPTTTPHYPRGWAMASGTPFRLYKINTHAGGHSVPMVLAGPGIGEGMRRQFAHVTDVLPTLLDLLELERPSSRGGVDLQPLAGASFVPAIGSEDAASTHPEQIYEMVGHRGYYRDGWEAVTLHQPLTPITDAEWELYDLHSDPTEVTNLASERPELVAELAAAWEKAAVEGQVYPLDEGSGVKFIVRPPRSDVFSEPVTILPGTPTLERWRSQQLVANRSFVITVQLSSPGTGTLVAHGDQGGGYALFLEDGELRFAHNDGRGRTRVIGGTLSAPSVVEARFTAPGGGTWSVTLLADGAEVASGEGFALLFPMAPFQGIDVGLDSKSPVVWGRGSFPFTGAISSVTYTPGEPAPDSPAMLVDILRDMGKRFE